VAWTSCLFLAAQGCASVEALKTQEPTAPRPAPGSFWAEPGLTDPAVTVANHVDRRSFVSMAQLAALDTIADRAPSKADYDEELHCLAKNIYFEARGESDDGKRAVAHVVLNRVADKRFPTSVCRVVYQGGETVRHRCQFSWWCDGQSDTPRDLKNWEISKALAEDVFWGRTEDKTAGALWYHADYVSPYWGKVFERGPKIGRHFFYNDNKKRIVLASSQ
jgi:spore germination cell wall hydrolase CwlJ-like protein